MERSRVVKTLKVLGPLYFMPKGQFYALAIFVMGRLGPRRGGVEVMGQTASLLAKAVPSLQHHSSIGNESVSRTIFLYIST